MVRHNLHYNFSVSDKCVGFSHLNLCSWLNLQHRSFSTIPVLQFHYFSKVSDYASTWRHARSVGCTVCCYNRRGHDITEHTVKMKH